MAVKPPSDQADPGGASGWVEAASNYAQIPGMDPYAEWALGTGRQHFFRPQAGRQQRWLPVLIRLNGISPQAFVDGQSFVDDGQSLSLWRGSIRLSPLYARRESDSKEPYCTAMVRLGFFEFLKRNETLRAVVTRITIGLPLDAASLPSSENTKENGNGHP
jgi:hypothetical protein